MKTNELKEKRAAKIAELKTISTKAETENRDLSGEERTRFDALTGEVEGLNRRLTDAERLAEFERLEGRADPMSGAVERRGLEGYSVAKAIAEGMNGNLTGQEAEWDRELSRGAGEKRGAVRIPAEVVMEARVLKTTTPGAGPGSNLVATDLAAMSDRRRAALRIEGLGATILRGLTGNLDLPRLAESGTAGWIAEHTDAPRSDPKFKKTSMAPKTVSAEYEVSRRMLLQSQQALEPILRADLAYLLSQQLDAAAIRGGGAYAPTGILADPNVVELPSLAAASPMLADLTADLIAALETDDVTGTRAFLTNPSLMAKARKVRDADGHPIPTAEQFHNERVETSTQVPGNVGAETDADALIYGEWASLYLGYWSGIDILVNPYHADVASKGGALIHAFLDCDVAVRHPEAFRWAAVS